VTAFTSGLGCSRRPETVVRYAVVRTLERLEPLGHEPLDLGEEHELGEPIRQKKRPVRSDQLDVMPRGRTARSGRDELGESLERRPVDALLGHGLELELDLADVLHETMHSAVPRNARVPRRRRRRRDPHRDG
jgi:hypothetical protein